MMNYSVGMFGWMAGRMWVWTVILVIVVVLLVGAGRRFMK